MKLIYSYVGKAKDLLEDIEVTMTTTKQCEACAGTGYLNVQDGPDDYAMVECTVCDASGVVPVMPF